MDFALKMTSSGGGGGVMPVEIVTGGTEPCFISTDERKFRKSKIMLGIIVVFVR